MMVAAGLTPSEAIRAATSVPAEVSGMDDRRAIKPGLRADLVLLKKDPSVDIGNVRAVEGVWVEGVRG